MQLRAAVVLLTTAFLTTAAGCSAGSGLPSTGTDVTSGQAMLDLSQNLVQLREDDALLQAQVDSLRGIVAYQDTVLRQLAGMAGVPMRPQSAPAP